MPAHLRRTKSFCRLCHVFCGITVDVDPARGQVVAVHGDRDNPFSRGYTCLKGRAVPQDIHHPDRLVKCRMRLNDSWRDVDSTRALDDISAKLREIAARYGPRAVAAYLGTGAAFSAAGWRLAKAWLDALGSSSFYTPLTVDKPGIIVAAQRFFGSAITPLGMYGGVFDLDHAAVAMFIGTNPVVSHGVGIPYSYPAKRLHEAQGRGMKLIVIDPRRSESAQRADLHLQVRPGEDAVLLAGIIRCIIENGWYDRDYVEAYVSRFDDLSAAVNEFDLQYVAQRTQVPEETIKAAAKMFACARSGAARFGVGVSMARHQNVTLHLVHTLNALCGRIDRQGGLLANPGVFSPPVPSQRPAPQPLRAEVQARVRGLSGLHVAPGYVEMPSATLSDEILEPGDGQIRALVVLKGNPVLAFPDRQKTVKALCSLDLLVVIDTSMTATARYAHYVLPTKHFLERPDLTLTFDKFYPTRFAQYSAAVVPGPEGLLEDWEIMWELASRMGLKLSTPQIDMEHRPTSDEVLTALAQGSSVPLEEVRRHPSGQAFGEPVAGTVIPAAIAHPDGKLAVGHPDAMAELRQVRTDAVTAGAGYENGDRFTHRLISMRASAVYNTKGREFPGLASKQMPGRAFLHPQDLYQLKLKDGDLVVIDSGHGRIRVTVHSDDRIMPGVIAVPFGLESRSEDESLASLIPNDRRFDAVTGMALQTAVPVNIR